MTVSDTLKKMLLLADGNRHDIAHLLKVYSYAKTIGECEQLDTATLTTLEHAAIVHDIACPLCRIKYGNTNGKNQETESAVLVQEFFADTDLDVNMLNRIVYLVSHHHTINNIEGLDFQILIEADYLVNADESNYSIENISNTLSTVFRTKTGRELLTSIYLSCSE